MLGSVHPRFQLDCLQIWCAGRIEQRHSIEVAELITLAATYYCYRRVVLRLCTGQASRGAVRILREAIVKNRRCGLAIELEGHSALAGHLTTDQPVSTLTARPIGFSRPNRDSTAYANSIQHAKRY